MTTRVYYARPSEDHAVYHARNTEPVTVYRARAVSKVSQRVYKPNGTREVTRRLAQLERGTK